ncbi:ribonuclease 3-like protein 2 [Bidens hawaiensis]|uniref:ribonuclease 3-like protein 2 n=1 Tax=Bidens hawaiensis TaxID=980011 RepID=UPI00404AF633
MMDMEYSVAAVESIIKYTFKDKKLLEQALTHPTFTDGPSYVRLEFLGDSALGLAISSFFFLTYPDIDSGKLSDLRAANVSNEKLVGVAVHHGLYKYIRHSNLTNKVWEFFGKVEEEEKMAVYGGQMTAPKVLADVVESMAGAVFIDCGFDLQLIWMIFRSLLEPLVMLDVILTQPQPITALYGACGKDGKQVDIRYSKNGGRNIASVFVDNTFIASGSSDSPKNAKLHAAEAALLKITKSRSGSQNDLDFNELMEIEDAKQKLLELCKKKKWPKPTYKIEQALGPKHDKRYVSSVQVELYGTILSVKGSERATVKDTDNSAASLMFCALREAGYT